MPAVSPAKPGLKVDELDVLGAVVGLGVDVSVRIMVVGCSVVPSLVGVTVTKDMLVTGCRVVGGGVEVGGAVVGGLVLLVTGGGVEVVVMRVEVVTVEVVRGEVVTAVGLLVDGGEEVGDGASVVVAVVIVVVLVELDMVTMRSYLRCPG